MTYLIDTNVISELSKTKPDHAVVRWFGVVPPASLYLSVLTLGEIWRGIERLQNPSKKEQIYNWLTREVIPWCSGRILPIDSRIAESWGRLTAAVSSANAIDSLIAATAFAHRLILVTRNTKDFSSFGLSLLNPWEV